MQKAKRCGAVAAALVALALLGAYVARVAWVNATAQKVPVQNYAMGQDIALDGAFFESKDAENTASYSVRVVGAELMSRFEYLEGSDGSSQGGLGEPRSVVCLELAIRNDGDDAGAFNLMFAVLSAQDGSEYLMADPELWSKVNPKVSAGQYTVAVRPHTEYVARVPYAINSSGEAKYAKAIAARSFWWAASDYPIKKVVNVQLG